MTGSSRGNLHVARLARCFVSSALFVFLVGCQVQHQDLDSFKTVQQRAKRLHTFRALPNKLADIKKRGRLRVLTYYSGTGYFLYEGQEFGFDYALVSAFARSLNVELEIIVPPTASAMTTWLSEGGADLIAYGIPMSTHIPEDLTFTRSYNLETLVLVTRNELGIQLNQPKIIHALRKTAGFEFGQRLKERFNKISIQGVSDDHSDLELLHALEAGGIDYAVVGKSFAEAAIQARFADLRIVAEDTYSQPLSWVVSAESDQLLVELNRFLNQHYKLSRQGETNGSTLYNILRRFYFDNRHLPIWGDHDSSSAPLQAKTLSPYDDLMKTVAQEYGLDWRLLVAMVQVESNFDPFAESHRGAMGLMQLMPATFLSLGFNDIYDAEENLRAGGKYLKYLLQSLGEKGLPESEMLPMALASYNAGYGHILDARRLARKMGLPADNWYAGVSKTLGLLSEAEYYSQVKHGYCNSDETNQYVEKVTRYYALYKRLVTL